MKGRPCLQVSEWRALELPLPLNVPRVRDEILRIARTPSGPALENRAGLIRARGLVGLVATSHLDIQILPKVYVDDEDGALGISLMRSMLAAKLNFPTSLRLSETASVRGPIMELTIGHIAQALAAQLRDGVPRRYFEHLGEMSVIRGAVDLRKQARRMPIDHHRVAVRYAPLQHDNMLSRLFRAVVEDLLTKTRVAAHTNVLKECLHLLHDIKSVPLTSELVDRAHLNSLEGEWRWIVGIASSLVRGGGPDLVGPGSQGGLAILFPLEGLFEALVRRAVQRGLKGSGYGLNTKKSIGKLLKNKGGDESYLSMEPDIVIYRESDQSIQFIADAKWKRLKTAAQHVPTREDAYQMMTYLAAANVKKGFLCYPSREPRKDICHPVASFSTHFGAELHLVEIDVGQLGSAVDSVRKNAEVTLAHFIMNKD